MKNLNKVATIAAASALLVLAGCDWCGCSHNKGKKEAPVAKETTEAKKPDAKDMEHDTKAIVPAEPKPEPKLEPKAIPFEPKAPMPTAKMPEMPKAVAPAPMPVEPKAIPFEPKAPMPMPVMPKMPMPETPKI